MSQKSEIRKAYLFNKYVIITPSRAKRPRDTKETTVIKRSENCYFCDEAIDAEVTKNKHYIVDSVDFQEKRQVTCIKNIFPAVSTDNDQAYGDQEVIIETPEHHKDLADISQDEIKNVLLMYQKRTEELSKDRKIQYILCFKNQGSKAGASIVHSHSQVFATEIIPPALQEEKVLIENYRKQHDSHCPYCDIIEKETKSERLVFEDENVAAFTPFASEYHYETWIFPKKHVDNITKLSQEELDSFAKVLKQILPKMKSLDLSYNFFMDQVISDKDQHFYIKIQPRDSIWAGVELGSGIVINSVSPEEAAKFLKN